MVIHVLGHRMPIEGIEPRVIKLFEKAFIA